MENVKSTVTDAIKRPNDRKERASCGAGVQGYAPKANRTTSRVKVENDESNNMVREVLTANCT